MCSRGRPALLFLAALGGLAVAGVACREPTEIKLVVTTGFPCSQLAGNTVSVRVGATALATGPVTATSSACTDQRAGTLVVTPSSNGDRVTIEVMAALTPASLDADGNCLEGSPGCIHARRALTYIPHRSIDLPIQLDSACAGFACQPNQTCAGHACVPIDCSGSACAPPTSDAGAGAYGAICGDMSALQAGAPYPMSAGCPGGSNVSTSTGRTSIPTNLLTVPTNGAVTDVVIDKNDVAYVATASAAVYTIALGDNPPHAIGSFVTPPMAGTSMLVAASGLLYVATANQIAAFASDGGAAGGPVPAGDSVRSDLNILPSGRLVFADPGGNVESMDTVPSLVRGPNAAMGAAVDGIRATVVDGLLWQGDDNGRIGTIEPSTMSPGATFLTLADPGGVGPVDTKTALAPDGKLRVVWGQSGTNHFYGAVDRATRTLVWSKTLPGGTHVATNIAALTPSGALWVTDDNRELYAFAPDGSQLTKIPNSAEFPAFDVTGNVYTNGSNGFLASFDEHGTMRWSSTLGHAMNILRIAKSGVILGTDPTNHEVYVFY